MSTISKDLQASYKLLKLLNNSKTRADMVLDEMPGVFALIDDDFKILRGNKALSGLLKVSPEAVQNRSVLDLFADADSAEFLARIAALRDGKSDQEQMELAVHPRGGEGGRAYYWQLRRVDYASPGGAPIHLYTVIGKDISDYKEALQNYLRVAKDLEITRAVQSLLLPDRDTVSGKQFELAVFYRSADKTGGDWWAYNVRQDGSLLVVMGDVSGHGAGPAMVTATMAGSYRTFSKFQNAYDFKPIPEVFETLNQNLMEFSGNPYWMSTLAIDISPDGKLLSRWSAGSPASYLMKRDGEVQILHEPSTPLGSEVLNLSEIKRELAAGDRLFFVTDGVLECCSSFGRRPGNIADLVGLFRTTHGLPITEARARLVAAFERNLGGAPMADDLTFVLLDIR